MKRAKKYLEDKKKIAKDKAYSLEEAVDLVLAGAKRKFDQSLEIHFNLGIDPKQGEQQIRGSVVLPHGTGKTIKIAAFIPADKEKEAKEAGADLVGGEEMVKELIQTKKINFDVALATPDMMKVLAPAAKFLGPRGLMPSPKAETVTNDIGKTIQELKKGKITYKNDDTGNVHISFGKLSFGKKKLVENLNTLIEVMQKSKPPSSKGAFINSITLCSTMGPGIKVSV